MKFIRIGSHRNLCLGILAQVRNDEVLQCIIIRTFAAKAIDRELYVIGVLRKTTGFTR